MTLDLSGRVAVVTGASRGIGYFIAKELAAAGAHVIAVARTVGGLEELDDQIKAAGGQATLVLEGSGIMPNEASSLMSDSVRAVWLTMSDEVGARRIRDISDYGRADADGRLLIDRFIERNRRLDAYLRMEASRLSLPLIVVDELGPEQVADACLTEAPLR